MSNIGSPANKESIEGIEIWTYYFSYGTISSAGLYSNKYYANANASSWEMYDIIKLYFDNDKVIKYDVKVQR